MAPTSAADAWLALAREPWLFGTAILLIGLVVGSFLNVVILRLPRMMEREWAAECREWLAEQGHEPAAADQADTAPLSLAGPRSHCPACGNSIRARDNIPVLSWLLLRGRCRDCGNPISIQYPLVETASGLLALAVALHYGPGWEAVLVILFTWMLLAASVIDLRTTLLPDDLTLPLLWLGLCAAAFGVGTATPLDAILGAAGGYLLLWSVYHVFRLLTGKEGMGHGDFKLLAAIGAWTGWQGLALVVLFSSAVGALVGIALIVAMGRDRSIPIPFGPYLAAGGWIALLWGEQITGAYLRWAFG